MRIIDRLRARARALFRRARFERDMDGELHFHLAARLDDLQRAGLSRDAAEAQARIEFGDPLRWKEDCREARGVRLVDELRADVRYGVRALRRSPGFAIAAILSLALGIGANTAVFSLLDAVLLKSLPVHRPHELAVLAFTASFGRSQTVSYRMIESFRRENSDVMDIAASASLNAQVAIDGTTLPSAQGQLVSGNYYAMLGVPAAVGRLLLPEDDRVPGASAVAVLSYSYWQRQFGGDPAIVSRVVRINGSPFTIVGVSAPEFFGTHVGEAIDITMPLAMQVQAMPDAGLSQIDGDGALQFWLEGIGRLAPGVSMAQAEAAMSVSFQRNMQENITRAGPKGARFKGARLILEPGSRGFSELRHRFSQPLAVVMTVVALVLLIACANLANLLLARAAVRHREMAVRVSLGAGRGRLVRQLLTESFVLALIGGLAGLAVAWWAAHALAAALASEAGQALEVSIDLRVLTFTLGVSLLTGMLFGLAPALGASRTDPHAALTMGRQGSGGRVRARLNALLVAGQVAVSLLLLVGAGLFVRTLMNLRQVELGFTRETVMVTRLEPRGSNQKRDNYERLFTLYSTLLERVRAMPGVRAATLAGTTPLGDEGQYPSPGPISGYVPQAGERIQIRHMQIFPGYFSTLGIPLLAGRDFTEADNDLRARKVTIVNATFAAKYFGTSEAALGRTIGPPPYMVYTIVGVVGDVRDRGSREPSVPQAYEPFAVAATGRGQQTLIVRVAGDASGLIPILREHVRAVDADMPLRDIETITQRVDASLRQERLIAWLSSGFGLLALLLACVGLYGVMAYGVARRSAEFGLRMALGAEPRDVRLLVLRETWLLVALGVAIGVPLALTTSRLIARMLFGLAPTDPVTLAVAVGVLAGVATLAGYLPARRAAGVDPLVALRHD